MRVARNWIWVLWIDKQFLQAWNNFYLGQDLRLKPRNRVLADYKREPRIYLNTSVHEELSILMQ